MFMSLEFFGFEYVELYIKFQQSGLPQMVNAPENFEEDVESLAIIPNEDVEEDDVEEENKAQAYHFFTSLFEEGVNEEHEGEQHIPVGDVLCPPPHMKTLCLSEEHLSFEWNQIPRLLMDDDIVVGNQFKSKADCVHTIKKSHMKHCVDFNVNIYDKKRYQICCSNPTCNFCLLASYRKRSDF